MHSNLVIFIAKSNYGQGNNVKSDGNFYSIKLEGTIAVFWHRLWILERKILYQHIQVDIERGFSNSDPLCISVNAVDSIDKISIKKSISPTITNDWA